MRLLDLFCGGGGAAMGYHRAGFQVTGVDIVPQPRYPVGVFVQANALDYLKKYGHEYDFVHASPPCQAYSVQTPIIHRKKHPDLIRPLRDLLIKLGKPYVIENVPNARKYLISPIRLCGTGFGLNVIRHRYFELGGFEILLVPPCRHGGDIVYMTGSTGNSRSNFKRREFKVSEIAAASGIDWMVRTELDQAIPPAFTEFIGKQYLATKG